MNCENCDRLLAENERLRVRLLSAAGDDLCRLSQEEIKAMSLGTVKIPPKEEFLASCERFHAQVAKESGVMTDCLTLAQLVAENATLHARVKELEGELNCLAPFLAIHGMHGYSMGPGPMTPIPPKESSNG